MSRLSSTITILLGVLLSAIWINDVEGYRLIMATPSTTSTMKSSVKLQPTTSMPPTASTGGGFLSKWYLSTFFLPPWGARDTYRSKVSDDIFLFEQAQTFVNVSVNIRMTVIRLKSGDLFVHAPIAPTPECLSMIKELGTVKYIVLPVTAVEHKVYTGPFVRQFPQAKVYVAPGQYSFPINFGLGFRVDGVLTDDATNIPFRDEIEFTGWTYQPFAGAISEVGFFHKASRTLLVTDAAIYIDNKPPDVLQAKGVTLEKWKKMALQACFLGPPRLDTFNIISQKLFVSPVISILVVSRAKKEVADWINRLCNYPFTKIIPAHFSAPIIATPKDLRQAYSFLLDEMNPPAKASAPTPFDLSSFFSSSKAPSKTKKGVELPEEDTTILNVLSKFVSASGLAN